MTSTEKIGSEKRNGARILVVEDEARLLYSLSFVLKRHGYIVTPVTDAESALKKMIVSDENGFNLVISDMHLPGMSGLELIDKLHGMKNFTPFLMITAYKGKSIFDLLKKRGIENILQKPFSIAELMERISQALHQISRSE